MALITTIEELKKKIPVAYSNVASKMPSFEMAEERYLVDILGNALYQDLQENYDAASLSPAMTRLLDKCQAVIAPFSYVLNLPFLQTSLTDNGLIKTEAQNSRGAFRWEFNNVVSALEDLGYSAQESLILFLKSYATDFPLWDASPYNDPAAFAIIRDGAELRTVLGLQQPHRCFMMLRSCFNTVAELNLKEALSAEYYAALSSRIVAGTLSSFEKGFMQQLQMATARLAIKHAALELSIKFGSQGAFTIVDASTAKDNAEEGKKDPGADRLLAFAKEMESSGMLLLQKVVDQLNKNASETVAPEYFASNKYEDPSAESKLPYKNDTYTSMFVM